MQKVMLSNALALVPDSCVVLNGNVANEAKYVWVLAVKNCKENHVPPIVWLASNKEPRGEELKNFIAEAKEMFPQLKEIEKSQVAPIHAIDDPSRIVNEKEYYQSTELLVYSLADYHWDWSVNPDYFIIRKEK